MGLLEKFSSLLLSDGLCKQLLLSFRTYKCLLSSEQKRHIQVVAAESFAYLIRKSKDKNTVIEYMFEQLNNGDQFAEGLGYLIYHAIKGVKDQLNFGAEEILKSCLSSLMLDTTNKEQVYKPMDQLTVFSHHN